MARRDDEESPLADVDTYDMAEELADRMELKPKDRVTFIDNVMTRCGFTPIQRREAYAKIQSDDDDDERGAYASRWGFGAGSQRGGGSQRSGKPPRRRNDDYDPDKF